MELLIYPIVIPLVAGLAALLIPKAIRGVREAVALAGTLLTVYYAALVFLHSINTGASLLWFTLDDFIFSIDLRADALSAFILLAAAVFSLFIVVYSFGFMKGNERLREYYCYILWTAAAASTVILSDNLILLLIGWEVTTALLFFMVTMGPGNARDAAGKTFVVIGFSDCAMLLGIVLLWWTTGTMQISDIRNIPVDSGLLTVIYILLLVGALVKAGAMPGHSWIPKAAENAPISVIAYLPASLDKLLGIYLLARISLSMFVLSPALRLLLLIIGALTIILAVMMALVQHNLKKLLAFHAVSQVGYMVLGIGTGVPAGIVGGLFHMLNNAIYKCCLFLGAGAVEKRTGTTELENLGGLAKAMPVTFGAMIVAALSISGVPPFNGFVSKWLIYQGTIEIGKPIFLVAALFGSALTLASFIKVIHSVFLGKRLDALASVKPAGLWMSIPMALLALLCVGFGVFAQIPLKYIIGPAIDMRFAGAPDSINLAHGMWSPTLATFLIIVALVVGYILYLLSTAANVRRTSIFVGGEHFDTEDMRFPGTGFYETISRFRPLNVLYDDAEKGVYDLYVLGGRYGLKIVEVLRSIHNGIISTYIAFSLIGLLFLLFYLVRLGL